MGRAVRDLGWRRLAHGQQLPLRGLGRARRVRERLFRPDDLVVASEAGSERDRSASGLPRRGHAIAVLDAVRTMVYIRVAGAGGRASRPVVSELPSRLAWASHWSPTRCCRPTRPAKRTLAKTLTMMPSFATTSTTLAYITISRSLPIDGRTEPGCASTFRRCRHRRGPRRSSFRRTSWPPRQMTASRHERQ